MEEAQKVLQKLKHYKNNIQRFDELQSQYDDVLAMVDLVIEEDDESLYSETREMVKAFYAYYDELRITTLLSGEYDKSNAVVTLHPGAGGTEACDWVSMLYRMYTKWAEQHGYSVELLDYLAGDEAGIKSVTFQINGENAFGYFKSEKGVHRLVRISPFDSSGRRHTSFASCDVMPEFDDKINIDIRDVDLKVDTYHSSGAGGQHVNKTESAIRITHIPTGVVVQCQNERSQHKNRDRAMKMLKAKLFEIMQNEHMDKLSDIRGEVKDIGWSSQIRSYVFHPYSMVKDHRTGAEMGNIQSFMDGNIDSFINAYLLFINGQQIENANTTIEDL